MNIYSLAGPTRPCEEDHDDGDGPPEAPPAGPGGGRARAEAGLMAQVARLYHEGRLTQRQIAARLRCSQGTVCRLLKRAERRGIVRVTVSPPHGTFVDLEELLERKFGLAQAVIARAGWDDDLPVQAALGAAAAHFLETTLKARDVIGVGSGSATLRAMVEQMHPLWKLYGCRVVQLVGGLGDPAAKEHGPQLVSQLATLTRGQAHFLAAPGLLESPEAVAALAQDPQIRETLALFDRLTVALVGIGAVEPSGGTAGGGHPRFSAAERQALEAQGAVGEVCLRFYDARGQEVQDGPGGRVFGLEAARLRRVPRVVGIAGGKRKRQALLGAVRGRWVNALITDQFSAEALARA
jgi:DNA-binding transcriptional regulator LsrR (DeoR family)